MNIGSIQAQLQAIGGNIKKLEGNTEKNTKSAYSSNNPRIRIVDPRELKDKYGLLEKINLDSSRVDTKDAQAAQESLSNLTDLMKEQKYSALAAQSRADKESVLQVLS